MIIPLNGVSEIVVQDYHGIFGKKYLLKIKEKYFFDRPEMCYLIGFNHICVSTALL